MKFLNLKNGLIYNGSQPYLHYFEGGLSTNINHSKAICVVSDKEQIIIEMNSNVYSLINLYNAEQITLSQKEFIDLSSIKVNKYVSKGEFINNCFLHVFYIVAQSNIAGEIRDEFYIDGEEFLIAADFYGEDERLINSLENFECKVPECIQRAIYECNVHEESNDNILLNRKYKELLQNYWNIVMSKGSYNSLVDSLAWFEWGDLIRIEEYWLRHDYQDAYMPKQVGGVLDNEMLNFLSTVSKTTFYGIYCSLYKMLPNKFDSEGNPLLDNVLMRWSIEDISLKMILLGNFYQTYFMPLHLDLMHASIEHWVFTVNKKILNYNSVENNNTWNSVKTFECEYDKYINFIPQQIYIYDDTLFKENIGCSTIQRNSSVNTYFNSYCGVSKFHCRIPNTNIKKSKIIAVQDNEKLEVVDKKFYYIDEWLDFELFFKKPGQWNIVLEFETLDCFTYSKELNVYITETTYNPISLYKLEYIDRLPDDFKDIRPFALVDTFFSFNKTRNLQNIHFINNNNHVLNHVIICEIADRETSAISLDLFGKETVSLHLNNYEKVLKYLQSNYRQYIWGLLGREDDKNSPLRLYGVSKSRMNDDTPKINITAKSKKYRYVDEGRFVFSFWIPVKLIENKIDKNDIIISVPFFKKSMNIADCSWEFKNVSTGKLYKSVLWDEKYDEFGSYNGDFGSYDNGNVISNITLSNFPETLEKGYYDIKLKYKYNSVIQEISLNSAFYI